ncbi:MAG: DUF2490 domain-containing protein [Flavobacteriaceae bacterium]|nr:DUF2490 domain-containing protein [Flavobacteriaceae bacterium]
MKRIFSCCILLMMVFLAQGQASYEYGFMPTINLTKKLQNDWKINAKLEARFPLEKGKFEENSSESFPYQLLDFVFTTTKKTGIHTSLGGGYGVRWRSGSYSHIFSQQFAYKHQWNQWRLAHRIASDQRIQRGEYTIWRLRYRWRTEIPLNGGRLDVGEWYLKIGNEYLQILQDSRYELEIRLSPMFGKLFPSKDKIEFGFQYRMGKLGLRTPKHNLWLQASWYSSW